MSAVVRRDANGGEEARDILRMQLYQFDGEYRDSSCSSCGSRYGRRTSHTASVIYTQSPRVIFGTATLRLSAGDSLYLQQESESGFFFTDDGLTRLVFRGEKVN